MKNKITSILLLAPVLVLLVPLIAMQFANEVNWTLSDFVVMAILLYGAVFLYIFLSKLIANATYRKVLAIIILLLFIWLWAELAVGVFTNWGS